MFSCPVGTACRKRFQLAPSNVQKLSENIENGKEVFEIPSKCLRLPTSSDLEFLIILCRSDSQIASNWLVAYWIWPPAGHVSSQSWLSEIWFPILHSLVLYFSTERFVSDIFFISCSHLFFSVFFNFNCTCLFTLTCLSPSVQWGEVCCLRRPFGSFPRRILHPSSSIGRSYRKMRFSKWIFEFGLINLTEKLLM